MCIVSFVDFVGFVSRPAPVYLRVELRVWFFSLFRQGLNVALSALVIAE